MKFYQGDSRWQAAIEKLIEGELPPGWAWVNSSGNTRVAKSLTEPVVYCKIFLPRSPLERIKSLFRGSRCQRAIVQGEKLVRLGFHTPDILCAGRKGGTEFMVTVAFDGFGLGDYLASFFRRPDAAHLKLKRRLLREVGELVGRLHRSGIVHGDLRPNNILVKADQQGFHFSLIDNERNRQYQKIPQKKIHKNLVQITMFDPVDLTMTDRLRLWRYWSSLYHRYVIGKEKYPGKESGRELMRAVVSRVRERLAGKAGQQLMSDALDPSLDPVRMMSGEMLSDEQESGKENG